MAYPTKSAILGTVRKLCSDISVAGGQRYTDAFLEDFFQTAWSDLVTAANDRELPLTVFPIYLLHPAYSVYLDNSIVTFGTVVSIEEAGFLLANKATITGVTTPASGASTITSVAHPFTTGQLVYHFGIAGLSPDINDAWRIEKLSADTWRIRGTEAQGTYTSGGVAIYTSEEFAPLVECQELPRLESLTTSIGLWTPSKGRARLQGASVDRLLRVHIRLSTTFPSTWTSVPIENSENFLAYQTASLALKMDRPDLSRQYAIDALGMADNGGGPAAPGDLKGNLGECLGFQVTAQQRLPARRRGFQKGVGMTGAGRWRWWV